MSIPSLSPVSADIQEFAESVRLAAAQELDSERRATLGQFFTPRAVADLMASLSQPTGETIRLLDPGAGVGVLAAAWIYHACQRERPPRCIELTAYELDEALIPSLGSVLERCRVYGEDRGVDVCFEVRQKDFVRSAVESLNGGLFGSSWPAFHGAILNPPYRKFRSDSPERGLLREAGIETSNLYTAFVGLALRALVTGGELIAVTPRSFCNGPYFTPFRRDLLRLSSLTHVHILDSRRSAFGADDVLQENVIFRVERGAEQAPSVRVEWSASGDLKHTERRDVPFVEVVHPGDKDAFIHIAPDEWDARVTEIVRGLSGNLETIGLQVSTGRVVDFRAKEFLRAQPEKNTVPLVYPAHFAAHRIEWPKLDSRKPNALVRAPETESQLNPNGTYVLVKRFSSKEERRRVTAAVFEPSAAPGEFVAFENHLNYFHRAGRGLPRRLALGLAAYLDSTLVDRYFRTFNGHTQVNATDLRKLPYPTAEQLERIGDLVGDVTEQTDIDDIVEGELLQVAERTGKNTAAQRRISETITILKSLGLPKEQTNERAALTFLALLDLRASTPWSKAKAPLRGVTPIMEFVAEHYGKHWKPNTRETVRRFTLHQFQDAGLVVPNPDKPDRPVNSPAYCYQIPKAVVELLRSFGGKEWPRRLRKYLSTAQSLAAKYASEREMQRIPLRIREGIEITLSPGGQNDLIREIVHEFCPRFTPGATAIYVGDADRKWSYFDHDALMKLEVALDEHGKMPDVVIYFAEKNWLILIEAVTSHGPVSAKRRSELTLLFKSSTAPLVFVTAFRNRLTLNKYLAEIAWETEVWVADAPTHMIHFNGERFLGPYD